MKPYQVLSCAASLMLSVAHFSYAMPHGQGMGNMQKGGGQGCIDVDTVVGDFPVQALSKPEVEGLLYMRGEEKLARDVYLTLSKQWQLPIFGNIANSEQRHTSAIKVILEKYQIADPYAQQDMVGVFHHREFINLYQQLVANGQQSLVAALQVGATIEDLDIVDLEKTLAATDNLDVKFVYQNLMRGSRNHLRSFVELLNRNNGSYTPQYLTTEAYQAIINSPKERGWVSDDNGEMGVICDPDAMGMRGGKGNGRGWHGGR